MQKMQAPVFIPIDYDSWPRKDVFELFSTTRKCTFDITANITVTTLKRYSQQHGIPFSALMTYCISQVINSHPNFRTEVNADGVLGYWDILHPLYTIPTQEAERFTHVVTPYTPDPAAFTARMQQDTAQYVTATTLYPQAPLPANIFAITTLPWVAFTSISYNVYGDGNYMIPFVTVGKYQEINGQLQLPVSVQFHHATCDGFHAGVFFERLQAAIDQFVV
ncbi:hypothetical protein ABT58_02890 [Photobacterium aphoticum]|uniref:Chloramphenicol acetyltransferase n=2 Tax=Photobacterium aphoticum TaxID=754436 RepID=A0A0J1JK57_9GAMM|nr:hypothetical protein ABT58_02890 [Photobacterium aphoticum]